MYVCVCLSVQDLVGGGMCVCGYVCICVCVSVFERVGLDAWRYVCVFERAGLDAWRYVCDNQARQLRFPLARRVNPVSSSRWRLCHLTPGVKDRAGLTQVGCVCVCVSVGTGIRFMGRMYF